MQTSPLPKYIHAGLPRLLKHSPYHIFISAYPNKLGLLHSIVEKEAQTFTTEQNLGLIQQALSRAPRWLLKKLTRTYVTVNVKEIGKAVKIEDEAEVRALILSMVCPYPVVEGKLTILLKIESSDISAQISSDGTVTFSDPPPQFTRDQVDRILKEAQDQTAFLDQVDMSVARSREFLSKVGLPLFPSPHFMMC